jgi:hypothetical protein
MVTAATHEADGPGLNDRVDDTAALGILPFGRQP